jgi:uncharacterized surface protein with fasciclin (FAS1) repeats
MKSSVRIATMVAGAGALVLTAAACGSSTSSDSTPSAEPTTTTASGPFGPACSAVPASGPGSVEVIADEPVATAASGIPALSTLVAQVQAAGLVDTLNSAEDITVFAPTNDAFAAVPEATLKSLTDDPTGALANVLKYHVVAGELTPAQLPGKHTTLEGQDITITGSGEDFTINDTAKIVCGNVETANATVYVIDGVLVPPAS